MSPIRARAVVLLAIASLSLGACTAATDSADAPSGSESALEASSSASAEPVIPPVQIEANVKRGRPVAVDTVVAISAADGTLQRVTLTSGKRKVKGELARDRATWKATGRLESGSSYVATVSALDTAGETQERRLRFRTEDLPLDRQTYPSVAPLAGETVGVGMPVIVNFDVPVRKRALFEKHMTVTSKPAQKGSWHWLSGYEAHWRPKSYWRAGTDVKVDIDINSLPAGDGVYGQESRRLSFDVGDAVISKVNAQTYQMQTFVNGRLVKTIPITTGKAGFTTRSGVKVIMEKHRSKRMASETVGISEGDPEFYDIENVEYAMRLTHSGEFIHAAPWSTGSQGYANVSHGCTGMSTSNAAWLYSISKRGDVVEYTGTDRWMDLYNGYGDWNVDFKDYARGSAV